MRINAQESKKRFILILREGMMPSHSYMSTILRQHSLNNKYCEGTGKDCAWHSGKVLVKTALENFQIWQ